MWGLLFMLSFSSLTSSLSSLFPSLLCAFPLEVILLFPTTFSRLFEDVSCAPWSLALHSGVVFWFWMMLPFFPHWMATELIQYCGSVLAWGRTPVAVSTAFFHLQLFTHPLRCQHHPDALTVQGHMWLFYHHQFIFLIYLVSKQGHFGDCPGQWNIDFSAAVTGTVISLFQTSPCRVSLSHCLKSGWLTWLVIQLRRRTGY